MADLVAKLDNEICQILGKVLKYPWYKDDPKNFPDATESDGVCVGEHTAETIAMEAAAEIERLRSLLLGQLADALEAARADYDNLLTSIGTGRVCAKEIARAQAAEAQAERLAEMAKCFTCDCNAAAGLREALAAYKEEFENVQNTTKA